jgi:hypothetical protein
MKKGNVVGLVNYAKRLKVTGSIPDKVVGLLNLTNLPATL